MTGYKSKNYIKRQQIKYVTIHIYDHEVTWNESVSDSLDVTQQHTSNQSKAQSSFYSCTDLTFRFFSSVSKTFSSMQKETATFPAYSSKTWKHKWCSTWRICCLYFRFFLFSFFLWTAERLWCKPHLANGFKILMSRKAVCPFIHNSLADTSALAWLPVFEDLGNSSLINGVSNGSITTFLQTSPSISAERLSFFMSSN